MVVTVVRVFSPDVAPSVCGSEVVEVVAAALADRDDVVDRRGSVVEWVSIAVNGELADLADPASALEDVVSISPKFDRDLPSVSA
nr:hypothetical protein [Arthrobacter humicola]